MLKLCSSLLGGGVLFFTALQQTLGEGASFMPMKEAFGRNAESWRWTQGESEPEIATLDTERVSGCIPHPVASKEQIVASPLGML